MQVAEKTKSKNRVRTPEAVLYSRVEAAAMLSVSPRTLDYWIEKSLMRAVKLGRRRIGIPAAEVRRIGQSGIVDVRPMTSQATIPGEAIGESSKELRQPELASRLYE